MSSMYIATVYPCSFSIANGGFVSFVNLLGPGGKPLGKTKTFKSFELQRNLRKNMCRHHQFSLNTRHLSSQ